MKPLTDKHAKSLLRAITIMKIRFDRQKVPKFKRELGSDLKNLCEIALHVDSLYKNPMFSMLLDEPCELAV